MLCDMLKAGCRCLCLSSRLEALALPLYMRKPQSPESSTSTDFLLSCDLSAFVYLFIEDMEYSPNFHRASVRLNRVS